MKVLFKRDSWDFSDWNAERNDDAFPRTVTIRSPNMPEKSIELTEQEVALFYGMFMPSPDDDADDDLDEIADHDQQIWDIRETAKELALHLLRQSDMPSVMNDDAFATAIAERAVFLAKAMHAKLPARKC